MTLLMPSDLDLIARVVVDDDRHAFATLVRRYQSQVRSMLRNVVSGDADLADDLAQETFLRVWRSLSKFRGSSLFSTWVYSIAWNVFLSDARSARHRYTGETHEMQVEPADTPIDGIVNRLSLQSAMARLPHTERAALALTYGAGLSHEDAADVLGCPLGTLKTNVLRAKLHLKQYFADEGVTA